MLSPAPEEGPVYAIGGVWARLDVDGRPVAVAARVNDVVTPDAGRALQRIADETRRVGVERRAVEVLLVVLFRFSHYITRGGYQSPIYVPKLMTWLGH